MEPDDDKSTTPDQSPMWEELRSEGFDTGSWFFDAKLDKYYEVRSIDYELGEVWAVTGIQPGAEDIAGDQHPIQSLQKIQELHRDGRITVIDPSIVEYADIIVLDSIVTTLYDTEPDDDALFWSSSTPEYETAIDLGAAFVITYSRLTKQGQWGDPHIVW